MTGLHVLRAGEGPTLLLLHGIGSSATAWSKQFERLEGDFTCIAPDLPGYGDSPDPQGATLDALVTDVADVLQGAAAHVIGVSFGALTTLALARSRPDLVKSMVLSDATLGRATLSWEDRERWLQHREALSQELATRSIERAAEIAGRNAPVSVIEEIATHMRRARPIGYRTVARVIAETDARPWLRAIGVPALILCGDDDRVTGMNVSQVLLEELPDATLRAIADAGHAPHIEQPDRFAEAVRYFIGKLAP
jgi:pimeloyl-ACP methyl ester carboxylesterase